MANYPVKIGKTADHESPKLLKDFGAWLKTQTYGALGYFELMTETIPPRWNEDAAERLAKSAFSFLSLPDGSLLVLLTHDTKKPMAVVLLGSEGDTATVAQSLEAFLIDLSKGETGVSDIDDEGENRKALAAWLKEKKIKAPKAKGFDFDLWLAGETSPSTEKTAASAIANIPMSKEIAALSPKLRELAMMMGRLRDDPELVTYVTKTLGMKPAKNTSHADDTSYVVAKKHGIEMCFSHNVGRRDDRNPNYPPVAIGRSFQPYLICAWVRDKFGEPLPKGVKVGMAAEELPALLGEPTRRAGIGELDRPIWETTLDAKRQIVLAVEGWSSAKGAIVMLAIRGK